MKIDEMLKRLENVKIDENIDERREIAEYITRKFSVDKSSYIYFIMTKDKKIYDFDSYRNLFKIDGISPDDAYVYVENHYLIGYDSTNYFYPFLVGTYLLSCAYLSKLGLGDDFYRVVPATGLKYVVVVYRFPEVDRMVVEVADIGNVMINTNLPPLIEGNVRNKYIDDDDDAKEIVSRFGSRKLFAGYDFNEAGDIINRYLEDHDISLTKDVAAINYAYNRILQPYRTEYDLKSKQIIASFDRKPFKPPSPFLSLG